MRGRELQIGLRREATRSLRPFIAARVAGRQFVLPLLIASFLTVPPASGSPSRSEVQALGVRYSCQADYCQLVIDLSADVRYKVGHLSNPERVYLDLSQTDIARQLTTRRIDLKDGLVDHIRMGMGSGSVTRVVLDLHTAVRYRVSKLVDPARMLIELTRPPDGTGPVESIPTQAGLREAPGQIPARAGQASLGASPGGGWEVQGTSSPSSNVGESHSVSASGPHTYGDAEKAELNYAGTSYPRNVALVGFSVGSSYDDNIFGRNGHAVGDVAFLFGPNINLRREGRHLSLALTYQPYFRIYQKAFEQNSLNQGLGFDANYRVSSRLAFRTRTTASYTTGIFQPNQNAEFLPSIGSPSSLNETVFTPAVRQLAMSLRIDTNYQASARDSFGVFLGLSERDFKSQVSNEGNFQNTEGREAGLLYQHRLTPHTTVGIDYLYQDIRFGSDSRTLVHSAFFSYAQQLSPNLTLSVFGGPQYSRLHDVVTLPLDRFAVRIPTFRPGWNWAIGGTLTKRLDRAAFQLTGQHQISDGGGLLGAVTSSTVGASVRHRLLDRWDATWSAGYADNSSLDSMSSRGAYQSLTAGAGVERSLTEKLTIHVRYDFIRQRGNGRTQLFGSFDRDLYSVQFSYRFQQIALGR